jgi:hypothetical protein
VLAVAFAAPLLAAASAAAQPIPRDRTIDFIPLSYPRIVAQTEANARLHLFGNADAPGYRDIAPRDGVDDRRAERLLSLAERFGPILVQNTSDAPMDFRRFMEFTDTWILNVDTWNLVGDRKALQRSDTINLLAAARHPCPAGAESLSAAPTLPIGPPASSPPPPQPPTPERPREVLRAPELAAVADDCRLLTLLEELDPYDPTCERQRRLVVEQDTDLFKVLFFDFPGDGPETWKQAFTSVYSGRLKSEFDRHVRIYIHPFIQEISSNLEGSLGYDFVLQYYFFYPTNDGGNNHEGDWEHINVSITPLSALGRYLTEEEISAILEDDEYPVPGGPAADIDADPLVIGKIEYYFHHKVMDLDFARPNAYAPREAWEREVRELARERSGERWFWREIRYRAWLDDEETLINTHPIGFIGADNKGLDQLLAKPGGYNRDSHGTFPFTGLYKDVGASGASEEIASTVDHRALYRKFGDRFAAAEPRFERGNAIPFVSRERLELLPDWERVHDLVLNEPTVRREWAWLLLPIRFGYPATESPFAGVVAHAETGNLAPFAPQFQEFWNRTAPASGSHAYAPHRFSSLFPLGLQDTFRNDWGFLNATLPVLGVLPPLDLAWRVGLLPVRAAVGRQDPTFYPGSDIPYRLVSVTGGAQKLYLPDETVELLFTGNHGLELLGRLTEFEDFRIDTDNLKGEVEHPWVFAGQIDLFLGKRFSSQNTLWNSRSHVGFSGTDYATDIEHVVSSRLNQWELAGSFRYEVFAADLHPFLKLGYGWTWYRLEEIALDGEPLDNDRSPWFNQPSFKSFGDLLPSSWHYGVGLEYIVRKSYAPLPGGIDLGLTVEAFWTRYELGRDLLLALLSADSLTGGTVGSLNVTRFNLLLGLTLGF